jgi:phosphoribosyl-ATP pyrophosphohydrolase
LAHADLHALDRLSDVIQSRRGGDPATSRTARLFHRGPAKIAQKVGEEAVETAIAALVEPRERLVSESADLLYHLLVLWAATEVRPEEIWAELERRGAERPLAPQA